MKSIRSRVSVASALRFLASGGFNTLVTYLLYLVLLKWLPYQQSYSIAFASGIGLAYVLNRYYVFRKPGGTLGPAYVAMIYTGQYLLGLLIVSAWVDLLGAPVKLAPLVAIAISLPLTYLANARVFDGQVQAGPGSEGQATGLHLQRIALAVLIGLPVVSLALNALGWLHSGFDLPFYDDWRAYATGQIDSLDPAYLFTGINDTMAPVGFALDALAQRAFDGNSVMYQLLSMLAVLGTLLLMQWKLLRAVLGNPLHAGACFVFTLLMLQPGSYWGRENLAYHQALPLVFLLPALWLIVFSPWKNMWRLPAIAGLGVLAGFSYVSGAFGTLAAAMGILTVAIALRGERRRRILQGAAALAIAGLATSLTQFKIGVLPTMGAAHRGDARLALPHEPDFWLFFFGKVGRSLLLPESQPVLSLLVVLIVCATAVGVAYALLKRVWKERDGPCVEVAVVYGALAAMVFAYLLLVAAGRTNLRDVQIDGALDVFLLGFTRFHFFWAALLWPWVLAALVMLIRGRRTALPPALATASPFLCAAGIYLMISAGALGHFERHRMEAWFRNEAVSCLMTQLQKGEGIDCREFNMADLTPAYIYASRIGASFVRYFPVLPVELGVDDPPPWFRLNRDNANIDKRNVAAQTGGGYLSTGDAQFHVALNRRIEMENCVMLDVTATVAANRDDQVQVYFRRRGEAGYSEANSRSAALKGRAGLQTVRFRLESETGFEDTLRVDPVNKEQPFSMPALEVRCRLRYSTRPFFTLPQPPKSLLLDSAWMDPVPGDPYEFRAGPDPYVTFRTEKPQQMAECSVLDVAAKVAVQREGFSQLYFLGLGKKAFTERSSVMLPVRPAADGQQQQLVFQLESPVGFENKLRFDPVDKAQRIRVSDVKLSCLRRVSSTVAAAVASRGAGK